MEGSLVACTRRQKVISVSDREHPPAGASGPEPDAASPSAALPMTDIVARFEGEWILMRVTEHDEDHWPAAGHVLVHALVHAPRQADVVRTLATREPGSMSSPGSLNQPLFMFCAISDVEPQDDFDAILGQNPFDTSESM
jgi:hypothetical protein